MFLQNQTGYPYSHYPKISIRLAGIAYLDISQIPSAVEALGFRVVWGPFEKDSIFWIAKSLMYVAEDPNTNEYFVVIRGTNPDSLESWLGQDFDVGSTVPFNKLAPHAPDSARISQGTYNGMSDLLSLPVEDSAPPIGTFLQGASFSNLYVTGHSLGGTLTPTMFAYLNDVLYGGGFVHNMALWSFAGLTPGDAGFNSYFNSLFNPQFPWRIHNTLDIAPFFWYSRNSVFNIYNTYGLFIGDLEYAAIDGLFDLSEGNGYAQPVGDQALRGEFYLNDKDSWAEQAMHQHSHFTYISLVDQFYGAQSASLSETAPTITSASNENLTILNPQPFEVTATIEPRDEPAIESRNLAPINGKWIVDPVGPSGTYLTYRRTVDNQFLATTLLPQGTTIAQLLLDTEIAIVFKQNPDEKLQLGNQLHFPVIVSYELEHEIAISSHRLEPVGQPDSSIIAIQQPTEKVSLKVWFKTLDGRMLSQFICDDSIAICDIAGREHYTIGTPY